MKPAPPRSQISSARAQSIAKSQKVDKRIQLEIEKGNSFFDKVILTPPLPALAMQSGSTLTMLKPITYVESLMES